jgi:hypothetical protein
MQLAHALSLSRLRGRLRRLRVLDQRLPQRVFSGKISRLSSRHPNAASASRATFFASAITSAVVTNLGFAAQIGQPRPRFVTFAPPAAGSSRARASDESCVQIR